MQPPRRYLDVRKYANKKKGQEEVSQPVVVVESHHHRSDKKATNLTKYPYYTAHAITLLIPLFAICLFAVAGPHNLFTVMTL